MRDTGQARRTALLLVLTSALLLLAAGSSCVPVTSVSETAGTDGGSFSGIGILFDQYRLLASGALGRSCVFDPTCSRFAREAFERYGPLAGACLALDRWTRCHPRAVLGDYPISAEGFDDQVVPGPRERREAGWGRSLLPF